jgi:ATP-dependent DNA helicase RecG
MMSFAGNSLPFVSYFCLQQQPMSGSFFDTSVEFLKGVGPARADLLRKEIDVFTLGDLVRYYPFRYVDRTKFYRISELKEDFPYVQIKGTVTHVKSIGKGKGERMVALFKDQSGVIELIWFKGLKWMKNSVKENVPYVVFGKPTLFNGSINIVHPELDVITPENENDFSGLQPYYNTTELCKAKGLNSKTIYRLQKTLISRLPEEVNESLSNALIKDLKLLPLRESLINIHLPSDAQILSRAQFRLKFEEFFFLQLRYLQKKIQKNEQSDGKVFSVVGNYFNTFFQKHLPFELTNAQKRVLKEIRKDTQSGKQMNRLLQGDVGSGKTLVAFMSMLLAADNGCQACLMAPTEILAIQHFNTLKLFAEKLGLKISLLTGSTKPKVRYEISEGLSKGEIKLCIGTHALIEEAVKFSNLGLVVIDEQHRFGVEQRARLWMKNSAQPHVLVMTATPIPRTLAMTVYGDLDVSVIDEMPKGRKPVTTVHRFDSARKKVYDFIRNEIAKGRQVFIVYPLIEESEKLDLKNLQEGYENVKHSFPPSKYKVSIAHGRMKPEERDAAMQEFLQGKSHILVATTVIEVGVDVPNASVMIIESAERFGLSQLHQLRGRVGRGSEKSYCILMTGSKQGEDARQRIETMCRTNDGFEIAEMDLRLRGPGDITGTQQSGILNLRIADLSRDQKILEAARDAAQKILLNDPKLILPENSCIHETLMQQEKVRPNWSKVS